MQKGTPRRVNGLRRPMCPASSDLPACPTPKRCPAGSSSAPQASRSGIPPWSKAGMRRCISTPRGSAGRRAQCRRDHPGRLRQAGRRIRRAAAGRHAGGLQRRRRGHRRIRDARRPGRAGAGHALSTGGMRAPGLDVGGAGPIQDAEGRATSSRTSWCTCSSSRSRVPTAASGATTCSTRPRPPGRSIILHPTDNYEHKYRPGRRWLLRRTTGEWNESILYGNGTGRYAVATATATIRSSNGWTASTAPKPSRA